MILKVGFISGGRFKMYNAIGWLIIHHISIQAYFVSLFVIFRKIEIFCSFPSIHLEFLFGLSFGRIQKYEYNVLIQFSFLKYTSKDQTSLTSSYCLFGDIWRNNFLFGI